MKLDVTGRCTNVTGDADGSGTMNIALSKQVPIEGGEGTREAPAGHISVRLPEEDAGAMWGARRKRVRVTVEVLPDEEPKV